jgi:hypothetical protein
VALLPVDKSTIFGSEVSVSCKLIEDITCNFNCLTVVITTLNFMSTFFNDS